MLESQRVKSLNLVASQRATAQIRCEERDVGGEWIEFIVKDANQVRVVHGRAGHDCGDERTQNPIDEEPVLIELFWVGVQENPRRRASGGDTGERQAETLDGIASR